MRPATVIRLIRAMAAADRLRLEHDRVTFWFALRQAGLSAAWIERVSTEQVRRMERRDARQAAQLREVA